MNDQITGIKIEMTQKFSPKGKRVVVTKIKTEPNQRLGQVFKAGDPVKVTGWSKGKGFTGVMKRWGFKGGPRTHGQSDRQRAPGSIGQGTTPGRVFPGKKMPGRAGGNRVTISGLKVFEVDEEKSVLSVSGPIPGARNGKLIITKVGSQKAQKGGQVTKTTEGTEKKAPKEAKEEVKSNAES
jgi:ribosomal protein L3